jgi:hypothetical protein
MQVRSRVRIATLNRRRDRGASVQESPTRFWNLTAPSRRRQSHFRRTKIGTVAQLCSRRSLPHATAEADDAALARLQRVGQLATQHHGIALVRLRAELGVHAALSSAGNVFQPGAQAVEKHDVADRFGADIVEAEREVDFLARFGEGG